VLLDNGARRTLYHLPINLHTVTWLEIVGVRLVNLACLFQFGVKSVDVPRFEIRSTSFCLI